MRDHICNNQKVKVRLGKILEENMSELQGMFRLSVKGLKRLVASIAEKNYCARSKSKDS